MDIYILCFFALCIAALLSNSLPAKNRKIFYFISAAFILFLICFRDQTVGADTRNYCDHFRWFSHNDLAWCLKRGWEPGFTLLLKGISVFGDTANTYIIVMGLISLLPWFILLRCRAKEPIIAMLIFYCFFFTTAEYLCRQWCAMLIALYSLQFIVDRKFGRFFLCVIAAMLFHRTAVAMLPLYFLYNLKINNKLIFAAMGASMALGVAGRPIISFLRKFARMHDELSYNGGISMLAFLWLSAILVYCFAKRRLKEDCYSKLFFIMLLTAATIQPICFALSLWSRIVIYYSIALCFALPEAVDELLRVRENKRFAPVIWCTFIGLLFVLVRVFGWQASGEHAFKLMQF